jgi:Glycosyltransferase
MRILHLAKFYHPYLGGIEAVTKSIAEASVGDGHKVCVIAFSKGPSIVDTIKNVVVHRCRSILDIASQPISLKYVFSAIKQSRSASIIHVHLPNYIACVAVLLIEGRKPLVIHWHSDVKNKGILGILTKPLERFVLKKANTIIATTEVYATTSPALENFLSKVVVIPIGIENSDEKKYYAGLNSNSIPSDINNFIENKFVVLSVGRLVKFKGIEVLCKAVPLFSDNVVVIIVGDGPEQPNLVRLVNSLNIQHRVFFTGALPSCFDEGYLGTLYQRSHIFCLPSINRSESFGVVLLESMLYGLPSVVSNIPGSGVNFVVEDGVNARFF